MISLFSLRPLRLKKDFTAKENNVQVVPVYGIIYVLSRGRIVPVSPAKSARSSGCQRGIPLRIRSANTSNLVGEPAGASVGRKSSVTMGTKSSSCPISKSVSKMFLIWITKRPQNRNRKNCATAVSWNVRTFFGKSEASS